MTAVDDLALGIPLVAAPMAGGPSTPTLVAAAATAGALGFLAGGYASPERLAGDIAAVRRDVATFGVNLFAPNPVPVDPDDYRRWADVVRSESERYGLDIAPARPREDDDHWAEKLSLLLDDPVPVVSFTFNVPPRRTVKALQDRGSLVMATVTSAGEALIAEDAGADILVVQSSAAGGHSATLTPARMPAPVPLIDLLRELAAVTQLSLVAAGGISTSADVALALQAGAAAAMVGTALLRTPESGAAPTYKAALADVARNGTVMTRAFTGRPARALRNAFADAHTGDAVAGFPAIHYLTSPMRRAAAAAGDPERINLWAGTGYRNAAAEPAADVFTHLSAGL